MIHPGKRKQAKIRTQFSITIICLKRFLQAVIFQGSIRKRRQTTLNHTQLFAFDSRQSHAKYTHTT